MEELVGKSIDLEDRNFHKRALSDELENEFGLQHRNIILTQVAGLEINLFNVSSILALKR
jgi:hypothetical protein